MSRILLLIILLTIPLTSLAALFSTEEWVSMYLSPCPKTPDNRVCFDKTKRNFGRMLKYKKLLFGYLEEYNLPMWLATICVIESECYKKALSKSKTGRVLAVGLMQIAPVNLKYYLRREWSGFNYNYIGTPKLKHAISKGMDPEVNVEIACKILRHLYDKYGHDQHETVTRAYNAGETRINKALKVIGKPLKDETLNYFFQLMALQILIDGYDVYFSD